MFGTGEFTFSYSRYNEYTVQFAAVEWLETGSLNPLSCFPFTSLLCAYLFHHIVVEL